MLSQIKKLLKKFRSYYRYAKLGGHFDINIFQQIFIDPCFDICNLNCPYCPVGQNLKLKDMSQGMMSLATLKTICDKSFRNYRGTIGLYNWGESFLNPEIVEIVRYLKQNTKARLVLNSNFSFNFDERILGVLQNLRDDTIIISCDGFSQDTCAKYRVKVDFTKVMSNIELMVKNKNEQTKIKWQYLVFPWTMNEINKARAFCAENNITFYTGEGGITPDYPMMPSHRMSFSALFICETFLNTLTINDDGEVYPCCAYFGPKKFSLGNAKENSLSEIFSRGKGRQMLDYLAKKNGGSYEIFCRHCVENNIAELESWKL